MVTVTAVVTWIAAGSVASDVGQEQIELENDVATLERENATLQQEHEALKEWVRTELRPWVIHQAYKQSAALPSSVPTPSLAPLPPVPVELTPSPSPEPSPIPTEIPTPSPTCIPLVDICT